MHTAQTGGAEGPARRGRPEALLELRAGLRGLLESGLLVVAHERAVRRLLRLAEAQLQAEGEGPRRLGEAFEALRAAHAQLAAELTARMSELRAQISAAQKRTARPVARHSIATILARGPASRSVGKQPGPVPPAWAVEARQTAPFAARPRALETLRIEAFALQRALHDERRKTALVARQARFRAVEEALRVLLALAAARQRSPTALLAAKIERLLAGLALHQIAGLSALWTRAIERVEVLRAAEEEGVALRAAAADARIEASKAQLENLALQHLRREGGAARGSAQRRAWGEGVFVVLRHRGRTESSAAEGDLLLGLRLLCEFVREVSAGVERGGAGEALRRKALIALSLAESLRALPLRPPPAAPDLPGFLLRAELLRLHATAQRA